MTDHQREDPVSRARLVEISQLAGLDAQARELHSQFGETITRAKQDDDLNARLMAFADALRAEGLLISVQN